MAFTGGDRDVSFHQPPTIMPLDTMSQVSSSMDLVLFQKYQKLFGCHSLYTRLVFLICLSLCNRLGDMGW